MGLDMENRLTSFASILPRSSEKARRGFTSPVVSKGPQPLLHHGRPTDTWERQRRGDPGSLQVTEQVGLPLQPGGTAILPEDLGKTIKSAKQPQRTGPGTDSNLPENSQEASGRAV